MWQVLGLVIAVVFIYTTVRDSGPKLEEVKNIVYLLFAGSMLVMIGVHELKSWGETDIWSVVELRKFSTGATIFYFAYSLLILGSIGCVKRILRQFRGNSR